jgi:hypothetical protein
MHKTYTAFCPGGGTFKCLDSALYQPGKCGPDQDYALSADCYSSLAADQPQFVWQCMGTNPHTVGIACNSYMFTCNDKYYPDTSTDNSPTCTGVSCGTNDLCAASRAANKPYVVKCPGGGSWRCLDGTGGTPGTCPAGNDLKMVMHCEHLPYGMPSVTDWICNGKKTSLTCYTWQYTCSDVAVYDPNGGRVMTAPDNWEKYKKCVEGCGGYYFNGIQACCCKQDEWCWKCLNGNFGSCLGTVGKVVGDLVGTVISIIDVLV